MKQILAMAAMLWMVGCTPLARPPEVPTWKLDNLKSIGNQPAELLGSPQVVKSGNGSAIRFDGQADGILLPVNPLAGLAEFTVEMRIKPDAGGPTEQRFLHVQDSTNARGLMELRMYENGWAFDAFLFSSAGQLALFDRTKLHPADRWTWVAMTYRDGVFTSYVDGTRELDGRLTFAPMGPGTSSIGVRQNRISWFKGELGEVRFHPKAIDAAALQRNLP